jgi:hypothetical protein
VPRHQGKPRSSKGRGATLPGVDGKSARARRFKDITAQIVADQAGLSECSETRLQLIRRFAVSAVLAEELEAKLANGEEIDVAEHSLLCSTLTRLAQRIGIDRRACDLTPNLKDYLALRSEEKATTADAAAREQANSVTDEAEELDDFDADDGGAS